MALDEPQIAVRSGELLAPRLGRTAVQPAGRAWRLGIESKGSLDGLAILPSDAERPIGPQEVRIGIRAAGLNFRDVLIALGTYPGEAPLGSEAAGVVLEVGADVTGLVPGERVMGLLMDPFGPVGITDHRMVVPMPEGWSFTEAAAMPLVFLTAYYALTDLGGVQSGERLLVHAAAGGVGMAAVQLARHWGVEVYATASRAKQDAVRDSGVLGDRIGSSRDLSFREQFLEATGGAGVDVVLNALAGEFIDASLDLLPRGGRFLEMGKADIRDAEAVAGARPGVRYVAFDLLEAGPDRIQQMLRDLVGLFEAGALRHSPIRSWDVRRGADAFRFLREGRNVGKVVLTVPAPLDPEGTVLITGGTGGLGASFAGHFVREYGAKHLLLLSRRGRAAEGVADLVGELEALGARVRVEACDVADRDELAQLVGSLERPLTVDCGAARAGAASEVGCGGASARVDGGYGAVGVRVVLVGCGAGRQFRSGELRRRERVPGCACCVPSGGGSAGDLAGLGPLGEYDRDDGHPGRGRTRPTGTTGRRCTPGRARSGVVRPGVGSG